MPALKTSSHHVSRLGWHAALLLLALMVVAPNFLYNMLLLMRARQQQKQQKKWKNTYCYEPLESPDDCCSRAESAAYDATARLAPRAAAQQQVARLRKSAWRTDLSSSSNTVKLV